MTPDPCKSEDPFVDDLLDMIVWLPGDSFDSIEMVTSSDLGVWKPPCGACVKWWAPVFAVSFVRWNEATTFQTFGVN